MIDEWLAFVTSLCATAVCDLGEARLVHWSPAEASNFERAYDNARARHPERQWPALPWFDLLEIVRREPVVVRGAFSSSLKSIARAMRANGLIATDWGEGLADGAGEGYVQARKYQRSAPWARLMAIAHYRQLLRLPDDAQNQKRIWKDAWRLCARLPPINTYFFCVYD